MIIGRFALAHGCAVERARVTRFRILALSSTEEFGLDVLTRDFLHAGGRAHRLSFSRTIGRPASASYSTQPSVRCQLRSVE